MFRRLGKAAAAARSYHVTNMRGSHRDRAAIVIKTIVIKPRLTFRLQWPSESNFLTFTKTGTFRHSTWSTCAVTRPFRPVCIGLVTAALRPPGRADLADLKAAAVAIDRDGGRCVGPQ